MEKLFHLLISVVIILAVMSLTYRVNFLHKIVFGKGSARVNKAASIAVANTTAPAVAS